MDLLAGLMRGRLVSGDVNDHIKTDLAINIGDVTLLAPPGDPQADED